MRRSCCCLRRGCPRRGSARYLNRDGFDALYPRYTRGRPPTFTLPTRREIKRIALSDPEDLGQPFSTWSLSKLADYLVAEGVLTDISHGGLRQLLHQENVRFEAVRTWKRSNDPDFTAKQARIVELYALAEAEEAVVICLDEFGPLNLYPQPGGKGWAPRAKPKRMRATYKRPHGVEHLISAYNVGADRLYGHVKKRKGCLEFCRYVRTLYPPEIRLHFALRYFTLAGTDHPDHATQAPLIRRYIAWRNTNTENPRLRVLVNTANVA